MGSKSQQQVQVPPSANGAFLVVMYIAAFVAAFNENIINVALHDIMAAFSVSATTAQWLVSGYMIVTSIFTAIMAYLSGRFSTRKLLFFACGCLVAGEVLCLVVPTFTVLLPSRILQAAGSGILFPLMMNVVLSCAPREKLGLYLSLGGACITLGPAFGPVISGLMCTLFGWRAVFVVPLVGGVVVAAAAAKLVRNVGERSNTTLDILSVVLLAAGITAFVYSVGEFSTNVMAGIATLFAAVVVLGLFAVRQLKLKHPVLNVRPMASVRFWPACLLVVVSMMTTFSMSVLLPLYFEGAYGMTALVAGLLILPAIACNAVTSIVGGRVMDARGAWPLLPVGFALIAVGQTAISMTAASMNIGVVVLLTVFCIVRAAFAPALLDESATMAGIAVTHSVFNVLCTAMLLPAGGLLEKLACRIVPDDSQTQGEKTTELDERLLPTPSLALRQSRAVAREMADCAVRALNNALTALDHNTPELAQSIHDDEELCDHYEDILGTYLVKLSTQKMGRDESEEATELLKTIGDFERISDHAVNILSSAEEMEQKGLTFSGSALNELAILTSAIREILSLSLKSFSSQDVALAQQVEPLEQVIDTLKEQMRTRHILRMQQGHCSIEAGFVLSDLLTDLERTSDHCSNIAGCVIDARAHNLNLHETLRQAKTADGSFQQTYESYVEKYQLPVPSSNV